jgi:hypothetical protein
MASDSDFGDLIYASQLKVERMHDTLTLPLRERLKSVAFKGVKIELDTNRANLVAKLRRVTDSVYEKYSVRYYYDPRLRGGEWFVGRMQNMAYGWARGITAPKTAPWRSSPVATTSG